MSTPTTSETQCPATYNKGGNVGAYGCHTIQCKFQRDHDGPHVDAFGAWGKNVTHEITHIKHEGQWFEVRDGEFQHIGEHLPFDFISAKYPE